MTLKAVSWAAVAVTLALFSPGAGNAAEYVARNGTYACSTIEQLDTLTKSINENMYEPYFYPYMTSGACIALDPETPLKVIDARSKKGKVKVRIQGVKKPMWAQSDALSRKSHTRGQ